MPAKAKSKKSAPAKKKMTVKSLKGNQYDYPSNSKDMSVNKELNKALINIGKSAGGYFGNSELGGNIADAGHRIFKQITGMGDYHISANTVLSGKIPRFLEGKGSVRVSHREFITDLYTTENFSLIGLPIQVGMPQMFPWLSKIAGQYQEYKINGLIFEFVSKSATSIGSTNTALGSVFYGVDYNALGVAPSTKQEILNLEFSGSCKPSESMMVPLECDPSVSGKNTLYVRTTNTPNAGIGDIRMMDFGKLYLATQGAQAASNAGEVWVNYDISLYKTKISKGTAVSDHFEFSAATTSAYFGTNYEVQDSSNFGCVLNANSITIPDWYEGQICILYQLIGDSTAYTVPTLTASGNVSDLDVFEVDTVNVEGLNVTSTKQQVQAFFNVIKADYPSENKITFSDGTLVANVTKGDLFVMGVTISN